MDDVRKGGKKIEVMRKKQRGGDTWGRNMAADRTGKTQERVITKKGWLKRRREDSSKGMGGGQGKAKGERRRTERQSLGTENARDRRKRSWKRVIVKQN